MTDIFRSFVAQRCLWQLGGKVSFHEADVNQLRNKHDLMKDFKDEVEGYLHNDDICRKLSNLALGLSTDTRQNMVKCYETLGAPAKEMTLLQAWFNSLDAAEAHAKARQ